MYHYTSALLADCTKEIKENSHQVCIYNCTKRALENQNIDWHGTVKTANFVYYYCIVISNHNDCF